MAKPFDRHNHTSDAGHLAQSVPDKDERWEDRDYHNFRRVFQCQGDRTKAEMDFEVGDTLPVSGDTSFFIHQSNKSLDKGTGLTSFTLIGRKARTWSGSDATSTGLTELFHGRVYSDDPRQLRYVRVFEFYQSNTTDGEYSGTDRPSRGDDYPYGTHNIVPSMAAEQIDPHFEPGKGRLVTTYLGRPDGGRSVT
jgi:hypothetical protein